MTKDMFAFYSKTRHEKLSAAEAFIKNKPHGLIIYVCPKKILKEIRQYYKGIYVITYEQLTQKDIWLKLNSRIGDDTLVILENPSRYRSVSSTKVMYLQKLMRQIKYKLIIDNVPYAEDIQYLYVPYSYLNRSILGYAHYYAFRENYKEVDESGNIVNAHDFNNLAGKIRGHCKITYSDLLNKNREIINCDLSQTEHKEYKVARDNLFKKKKTPQPIITALSDMVHAFESRYTELEKLLGVLKGKTIIYTNLSTYGCKIRSRLGHNGFTTKTYADSNDCLSGADNVIYFESPIVKTYLFVDIETSLPDNCNVYHFVGDSKVDKYLFGRIQNETEQINLFTQTLKRVQENG